MKGEATQCTVSRALALGTVVNSLVVWLAMRLRVASVDRLLSWVNGRAVEGAGLENQYRQHLSWVQIPLYPD